MIKNGRYHQIRCKNIYILAYQSLLYLLRTVSNMPKTLMDKNLPHDLSFYANKDIDKSFRCQKLYYFQVHQIKIEEFVLSQFGTMFWCKFLLWILTNLSENLLSTKRWKRNSIISTGYFIIPRNVSGSQGTPARKMTIFLIWQNVKKYLEEL